MSLARLTHRGLVAMAAAALAITVMPAPATAASLPTPLPQAPRPNESVAQPEFQWVRIPTAIGYQIQLALDHRFASVWKNETTPANRYIPSEALPAGSFWWRVRALYAGGRHSAYSSPRAFSRRWSVTDGAGSRSNEVARPDRVRVEDFDPATPGVQAPRNGIKIWWEPVANASEYEVQFDGDQVCTTTHTVLTPNAESNSAGEAAGGGETCTLETEDLVTHWVRVRAVDRTTGDRPLYSLWSDQARSTHEAPPGVAAFALTDSWLGDANVTPAVLTHPRDDALTADAPVLEWNPVSSAPEYRVVIARDADFTNVVGDWRTTNTRFIPTDTIWDHTAMRSYFWMVLPCFEFDDGSRCLNENTAVNRTGRFRAFRKQTLEVSPRGSTRNRTPWTTLRWDSFSRAVPVRSSSTVSVPGLKWYEIQYRPQGTSSWNQATTSTSDVTSWLSASLPFGTRVLWRVRAIDGTGEPHAWSEVFTARTPSATPEAPTRLRAKRTATRLTLSWSPARARYFAVLEYSLWYSVNGKRWRKIGSTAGTGMRLRLGSQKKFLLRVSARNSAGEGRPSASVRIR